MSILINNKSKSDAKIKDNKDGTRLFKYNHTTTTWHYNYSDVDVMKKQHINEMVKIKPMKLGNMPLD